MCRPRFMAVIAAAFAATACLGASGVAGAQDASFNQRERQIIAKFFDSGAVGSTAGDFSSGAVGSTAGDSSGGAVGSTTGDSSGGGTVGSTGGDPGKGKWKRKKNKGKGVGNQGMPPGLAKKGKLPPGIAKRQLPSALTAQLPPPPDGFERVIVENDVLLVNTATQVIHDALTDVWR